MKSSSLSIDRSRAATLAAALAFALAIGTDGKAQVKQGYKEAPTRRVESATKNAYCEDSKRLFRACYIPCVKSYQSDLGNVVNHCNAECHSELAWVNYLCRK